MTRKKQLHVMLSEAEYRQLQDLADDRGLTASDWLRQRIRDEHAELAVRKLDGPGVRE